MRGLFITFEGIEGTGKTTQIRMLDRWLKDRGFKTLLTREPGGTHVGDQIRAILLSPANKKMVPMTELLLYAAARAEHVAEIILPSINEGKIVLSDRYADATTAYQGAARKIDPRYLSELHKIATNNLQPDLTFLLDLPPDLGLERAKTRNTASNLTDVEDRFEREELSFHKRVREGYLSIAKLEPKRFRIIDATKSIDDIHREIVRYTSETLKVKQGSF